MKLGEAIKQKRMERGLSVEEVAEKLDISVSTLYRYEAASIERIPVKVYMEICSILDVDPAELIGSKKKEPPTDLPDSFESAEEAAKFIVKMPTLAAYGGYNPDEMDDDTILDFANELLDTLKFKSLKYSGKI